MKIIHLSDTHNYLPPLDTLPEADILIHSGDATNTGKMEELVLFSNWLTLACQKYKYVIFVPGNHDRLFGKNTPRAYEILSTDWTNSKTNKANLYILIDKQIVINDLVIYGTPHTPSNNCLAGWYYYLNPDEADEFWTHLIDIGIGCHVLVTHGPPYRILDTPVSTRIGTRDPHQGCKGILNYVKYQQPILHLFGHIHEEYGIYVDKTTFVNTSIRDENYNITNFPRLITLVKEDRSWKVSSINQIK